jgi:ribulose-phosphate 3-epimerase
MASIYPSLIAANPLYLHETIKKLEPYCAGFHCDVMDNHFVPNLTFGADTVNAIDAATKKPVWVHLMVDNPLDWCKTLSIKANSIVSFHLEATKEINEIIKRIKENNWKASIAINPKTDVAETFTYLSLIDQVLIMSVEPGFSGQRFLEPMIKKVAQLVAQRKKENVHVRIGMDGGITAQNIGSLVKEKVDDLAIASAIFNQPDPIVALQQLSKLI